MFETDIMECKWAAGLCDERIQGCLLYTSSREEGSGTRGAFIELFGIETKDTDGNKIDNTTDTAEITNSTSVMMTTVAGNEYAIGYVSLGSLDDSVKALKIDGAEASVDTVKAVSYTHLSSGASSEM